MTRFLLGFGFCLFTLLCICNVLAYENELKIADYLGSTSCGTGCANQIYETIYVNYTANLGRVYLYSKDAGGMAVDDEIIITTDLGTFTHAFNNAQCNNIIRVTTPFDISDLFLSGQKTSVKIEFKDNCGYAKGHTDFWIGQQDLTCEQCSSLEGNGFYYGGECIEDNDKDGHIPIGVYADTPDARCLGDCNDNLEDDLSFCSSVVCCYDSSVDPNTSPPYLWEQRAFCESSGRIVKITEGMCEMFSNHSDPNKRIPTKQEWMKHNPAYADCSFIIHPGSERRCGTDIGCEANYLSESELISEGFVNIDGKWIYNGFWNGANYQNCGEDEQCVLNVNAEIEKIQPIPEIPAYGKECRFIPGNNNVNADCGLLNYTTEIINHVETKIYNYLFSCFPETENQIINSRYGEFGKERFLQFISNERCGDYLLRYESAGNFSEKCVKKDKCKDNADNDGEEDFFEMLQSKGIETQNAFDFKKIDGETVSILGKPFKLKLVDVDDGNCARVCRDSDNDSWCGTESEYYRVYGLDDFNQSYSTSKLFPDCDDISDDDGYQDRNLDEQLDYYVYFNGINQWRKKTMPDPLFFNNPEAWSFAGAPYVELGSKYVHPFAPLGLTQDVRGNLGYPSACTLELDLNCNKNGLEGYAFANLQNGISPFDEDLTSGREIMKPARTFSIDTTLDYFCQKDTKTVTGVTLEYGGRFALDVALVIIPMGLPTALVKLGVSSLRIAEVATSRILIMTALVGLPGLVGEGEACINAISEYYTNGKTEQWYAQKEQDVRNHCAEIATIPVGLAGAGANSIMKAKYPNAYKYFNKDLIKTNGKKIPSNAAAAEKPIINGDSCFLAGTKIMMADGSEKNIEDVKEGELVKAYDIENNKMMNSAVMNTSVRNAGKYRIIKYEVEDE